MTGSNFDLEPGDVVQLSVPRQNLVQYVRIENLTANRDSDSIQVSASEWDYDHDARTGTYVWATEENETIAERDTFDFTVGAVTGLAASNSTMAQDDVGLFQPIDVAWTLPTDPISSVHIEVRSGTGPWEQDAILTGTATTYVYNPYSTDVVAVRVRVRDNRGRYSGFVQAADVTPTRYDACLLYTSPSPRD